MMMFYAHEDSRIHRDHGNSASAENHQEGDLPESELKSLDQLLDPKWKGKIVCGDPRVAGSAQAAIALLVAKKCEDWVRKLFGQDLIIMKDERQLAESVVRGRYPILIGINAGTMEPFSQEGVADKVLPLDPDSPAGTALSGGSRHAMVLNKPPHPNAANVFLNWQLSREGQTTYVGATTFNSRRVDVPGPPKYATSLDPDR